MTNSAERVRITSGGSVGIGTASPAQKLHVYENANANSFILVENPNTGTSAAAVLRAGSDTALVNFQAHASTRTISRFGKTLGGWAEFLAPAAMGERLAPTLQCRWSSARTAPTASRSVGTGGVTVTGDFTVTGGTKNFAVVDPANSKSAIYFAALEGPEAGTYFRDPARMKDGEAVIDLPGYFSRITEPERPSLQLTPLGTWGRLYVAEKARDRLVIRAAPDTSDIEFDFLVQGVRKGYLDYEVERPKTLPGSGLIKKGAPAWSALSNRRIRRSQLAAGTGSVTVQVSPAFSRSSSLPTPRRSVSAWIWSTTRSS